MVSFLTKRKWTLAALVVWVIAGVILFSCGPAAIPGVSTVLTPGGDTAPQPETSIPAFAPQSTDTLAPVPQPTEPETPTPTQEICGNGVDDDGDGMVDEEDCVSPPTEEPPTPETPTPTPEPETPTPTPETPTPTPEPETPTPTPETPTPTPEPETPTPTPEQDTLPSLTLVQDAVALVDQVQLTADAPGQTGAAWLPAKQQVQDGFAATFAWQINRARAVGGDGFAFVIQNTSAMALGEGGSGMGYSGIANSLAVEFDTTQNTPEEWGGTQGDPNANHLSVQSRGTMPNSADPTYSLGTTSTIPALADGAIHQAQITYTPGTLTIFLDDFTTPVLTVPVDLATTLELSDGQAWVGFTAATGSRSQVHAIHAFSVTD
jgi:Bacterial lectin